MNLFKLSIKNLRYHSLQTLVNILLLTLGVATITAVLLARNGVENGFMRDSRGIDLVVGAKGSPLQIILSSVYQMDVPTGNVPFEEYLKIKSNPAIKSAVPVSMGDSLKGFRIVGTEPTYLSLYNLEISSGKLWSAPLQAVLGSRVASETGLHIGDSFVGAHGLSGGGELHEESPYTVVGILNSSGTVADRLVLTGTESVWAVHDHHHHHEGEKDDDDDDDEAANGSAAREVTAVLIQYSSPIAAAMLPRFINSQSSMQAASPAMEITRLMSLLGAGMDVLKAFGILLVLVSGFTVFVTLYNTLKERRFELAVLRTLGATRLGLLLSLLSEGLVLTAVSVVFGIVTGHVGALLIGRLLEGKGQVGSEGITFIGAEGLLIVGVFFIGVIASLIPAIGAYRTDIHDALSG